MRRPTTSPRVKASRLTGATLARAYENALRTLDRDAEVLDQLRSRANILLAALAIGVTVLSAILTSSSSRPHLPTWFVVMSAVFLGTAILCCIGVLWPTRDHGKFTTNKLERLCAEAQARVEAAAVRDAAVAEARARAAQAENNAREAIERARADAEALIRAAGPVRAQIEVAAAARIKAAADRDAAVAEARARAAQAENNAREAIEQACAHAEAEVLVRAKGIRKQAKRAKAGREPLRARDTKVLLNAATEARDRAALLAQVGALVQARVQAAANRDTEIALAKEMIEQVRADAEALIRATETRAQAKRSRNAREPLRARDAKVLLDAATETRDRAALLEQVGALVQARGAASRDAEIAAAEEAIKQVRLYATVLSSGADALIRVATDSHEHAVAYAAVPGPRRPFEELADRAWEHFKKPWREWRQALGRDWRLWKTGLNEDDLAKAPPGGPQDEVDQVLLEFMYLAHKRNNGTLSRRADLLRLASLLVLAFVIALSVWLPSQQ